MTEPTKYAAYTQSVAQLFIEGLETGQGQWIRPWKADELADLPHNPTTGKPYTRGNETLLNAKQQKFVEEGKNKDPGDNRWATYQQWLSVGGQVRKGEKATRCISRHFPSNKPASPAPEEQEREDDSKKATPSETRRGPGISSFDLFHASQVEGVKPREKLEERPLDERIARVLELVEASGAVVEHGGNVTCYTPARDVISMPERSRFKDDMAYASVLLHELGHWTGHPSRLNREFSFNRNGEDYAREELRVEIFSFMCAQRLRLDFDPDLENHMAYVADWSELVKKNPEEVVKATRDADTICQHLNIPAPTFEKLPEVERVQKKASSKLPPPPRRVGLEDKGRSRF